MEDFKFTELPDKVKVRILLDYVRILEDRIYDTPEKRLSKDNIFLEAKNRRMKEFLKEKGLYREFKNLPKNEDIVEFEDVLGEFKY